MESSRKTPPGFIHPSDLPANAEQGSEWQRANQSWWQENPMRYDWKEEIGYPEFSKPFYEEIDRRFFSNVHEFMPWSRMPFDNLIDFEQLAKKDVLEIGVGNGSHAGLLASNAKSFTGIDLTEYAVSSTSARLKEFGLPGTVLQMDAEQMQFEDNSFDFVWSWGVIHHSSDTRQILREILRVLRPGGVAITMVYHRSIWNYYVIGGLINGVIRGRFFRGQSLHEIVQGETDGAIARYYSTGSWRKFTQDLFEVGPIAVFGSKMELLPIPSGRAKNAIARCVPGSVARFFTNKCRFGSFLVSTLKAPH